MGGALHLVPVGEGLADILLAHAGLGAEFLLEIIDRFIVPAGVDAAELPHIKPEGESAEKVEMPAIGHGILFAHLEELGHFGPGFGGTVEEALAALVT